MNIEHDPRHASVSFRRRITAVTAAVAIAAPMGVSLTGCEQLPGDEPEQGAAIGGAGGALAGAALSEDNRLLGALVGGLLGAGGGYLIGSELDQNEEEAREAQAEARRDPATVEEVDDSSTADLNNDGFVTLDEVIAMEEAGLGDDEIIDRLRATEQVFRLAEDHENQLREAGVSERVIETMPTLNRELLREREADTSDRISQPAPESDE